MWLLPDFDPAFAMLASLFHVAVAIAHPVAREGVCCEKILGLGKKPFGVGKNGRALEKEM